MTAIDMSAEPLRTYKALRPIPDVAQRLIVCVTLFLPRRIVLLRTAKRWTQGTHPEAPILPNPQFDTGRFDDSTVSDPHSIGDPHISKRGKFRL